MRTINLGSNIISNCDSALVVNGTEVFRFHRRHHEGRLVCDFDVRNAAGERIAKVANDRVVYVADGYKMHDLPHACYVEGPNGETVARVEETGENELTVTGEFWVDSHQVLITKDAITSGDTSISGIVISGRGKAISLDPDSTAIGVD